MRTQLFKFLMNEADASPGGGAAIPPPVESPAQPATSAPAPGLTLDQVKGLFGELKTEIKNGVFAELRKTGALPKEKPTTELTTPQSNAGPAPSMTLADVQAMIERDRVVTTRAVKHGLSDAQTQRMRSALESVRPGDSYASEADAYLSDMGLAKAPTPAAPAAPTATTAPEVPKPPAAPSAPSGHGLPTQAGVVDLFSLNDQQRKDLGPKGIRQVLEQLSQIGNDQAGIPQRPKPPSQR